MSTFYLEKNGKYVGIIDMSILLEADSDSFCELRYCILLPKFVQKGPFFMALPVKVKFCRNLHFFNIPK